MDLERFDPGTDAGAVRACYDIHLAAVRADNQRRPPSSPRLFRSWLTLGWTEDPSEVWLARDGDGQACGFYLLTLPERENRNVAQLRLEVHPSWRRAGLGTALAAHAAARAREAGRITLIAHTNEGSAARAPTLTGLTAPGGAAPAQP